MESMKMDSPMDYLKIVLVAFVGVFLINKALTASGLEKFKA
jgi:hypothetical protein